MNVQTYVNTVLNPLQFIQDSTTSWRRQIYHKRREAQINVFQIRLARILDKVTSVNDIRIHLVPNSTEPGYVLNTPVGFETVEDEQIPVYPGYAIVEFTKNLFSFIMTSKLVRTYEFSQDFNGAIPRWTDSFCPWKIIAVADARDRTTNETEKVFLCVSQASTPNLKDAALAVWSATNCKKPLWRCFPREKNLFTAIHVHSPESRDLFLEEEFQFGPTRFNKALAWLATHFHLSIISCIPSFVEEWETAHHIPAKISYSSTHVSKFTLPECAYQWHMEEFDSEFGALTFTSLILICTVKMPYSYSQNKAFQYRPIYVPDLDSHFKKVQSCYFERIGEIYRTPFESKDLEFSLFLRGAAGFVQLVCESNVNKYRVCFALSAYIDTIVTTLLQLLESKSALHDIVTFTLCDPRPPFSKTEIHNTHPDDMTFRTWPLKFKRNIFKRVGSRSFEKFMYLWDETEFKFERVLMNTNDSYWKMGSYLCSGVQIIDVVMRLYNKNEIESHANRPVVMYEVRLSYEKLDALCKQHHFLPTTHARKHAHLRILAPNKRACLVELSGLVAQSFYVCTDGVQGFNVFIEQALQQFVSTLDVDKNTRKRDFLPLVRNCSNVDAFFEFEPGAPNVDKHAFKKELEATLQLLEKRAVITEPVIAERKEGEQNVMESMKWRREKPKSRPIVQRATYKDLGADYKQARNEELNGVVRMAPEIAGVCVRCDKDTQTIYANSDWSRIQCANKCVIKLHKTCSKKFKNAAKVCFVCGNGSLVSWDVMKSGEVVKTLLLVEQEEEEGKVDGAVAIAENARGEGEGGMEGVSGVNVAEGDFAIVPPIPPIPIEPGSTATNSERQAIAPAPVLDVFQATNQEPVEEKHDPLLHKRNVIALKRESDLARKSVPAAPVTANVNRNQRKNAMVMSLDQFNVVFKKAPIRDKKRVENPWFRNGLSPFAQTFTPSTSLKQNV